MKAKREKTIFICQITDTALKVIKCVSGNNARREFIGFEFQEIPSNTDERQISEKLGHLLKKLGYNNSPVLVSLPRSQATCRYLKIPTQLPEEIDNIASLQAPRYIPYPSSELITGYQVISTDKEGYSNINLTIVHQDVIARYLDIFKNINIPYPAVILSSYGLANLYEYIRPDDINPVMLADIDSQQAELAIVARNKVLFSRYFKFNQNNPQWQNLFLEEVNKTKDAYLKEVSREAPQRIIFLGNKKNAQELTLIFKEERGLSAEIFSYSPEFNMSADLLQNTSNSDKSFASLIGLGLKDAAAPLNLMPRDIREQMSMISRRREYVRFSLWLALIMVVLGLGVLKDLENKEQYIKKLGVEINKLAPEAKSLEVIDKRLQLLEGRSQAKAKILDIIQGLYQAMPAQVSLVSFNYLDQGDIILRGQTAELKYVFAFVSRIEEAPIFKSFNTKVKYATKKKIRSGEIVDFEVVCSQ